MAYEDFIRFFKDFLCFYPSRFYMVLLDSIRFHGVLWGSIGFYNDFFVFWRRVEDFSDPSRFYCGFIGFYKILLCSTSYKKFHLGFRCVIVVFDRLYTGVNNL